MEFEITVSSVSFIIDADSESAAVDAVDAILNENAYDWGQVVLL